MMMRERAELVRGVQAGKVSGVRLQRERKRRSAVSWAVLTKLRAVKLLPTTPLSTLPATWPRSQVCVPLPQL